MPVTIEPDDVNQSTSMLLADAGRVAIDDMTAAQVSSARRQLWMFRSAYLEAHVAANPSAARHVVDGEDLERHAPLHQAIAIRQKELATSEQRQADSIDGEMLFQDAFWTSRDGTTRAVALLSPAHRRSLVALLERNADVLADLVDPLRERIAEREGVMWLSKTPLARRLLALVDAQSGLDEARDRARQIARRAHFESHGTWPEEGPVLPTKSADGAKGSAA